MSVDAAHLEDSSSAYPKQITVLPPDGPLLNPRDILAQLAICDLVADSCDNSNVLVTNVDPFTTDDEIRALFGPFGDVKEITCPNEDKKTRVVSFYDIRSASRVCRQPVGTFHLNGKTVNMQFADTDREDDDFTGNTLKVSGMPFVVSNGDMFRLFGLFGDVKDVRECETDELSKRCFIVEFFDSRNARNAQEGLNNFEILGSRISVDVCKSLPLWQRRRLWQQQQQMAGTPPKSVSQVHPFATRTATHKSSQSWEQTRVSESFFPRNQFNFAHRGSESCNTSGTSTGNVLFSPPMVESVPSDVAFRDHMLPASASKPGQLVGPSNFPNVATNSVPILPSMNTFDFSFSPMAQQNMASPTTAFGFENSRAFVPIEIQANNHNRASSASTNNLMQVQPRSPVEMQPRPQFFSPNGFRSISGAVHGASGPSSSGRFHDFSSPSPSSAAAAQSRMSGSGYNSLGSSRPTTQRRVPQESRQDYYSIIIIGGRVLDSRTTLMIRNIPNKYTQRMLIERLDRENPGCYDFVYLPIDFKNNCNVGYAFVNMINTDFIPSLFATLHNKRWERFNSEKVCEIAYARIQGLEQLLEHFKNSSLLAEDKKVRPVILLNGRYVPFPDPDVDIRVSMTGTHKYLVTDNPEYL